MTRRVVMVDDEPDLLLIIREWVVPLYEFVSFTTGAGLIEGLPTLEPDLLILDVRLPDASGFELCRLVRSEARFSALPILFLTASHTDSDFLKNVEAGGSAYMTKPVGRQQLLAKIAGLLKED